ncbi:hypothetical protein BX616_008315 [Lobosporangium transversale]|uniref:Uncharacterized protein n=1 Tax=Lobosporangium transversale TaxID=64571 RepID=A0A1Y2GKM4_9FUNG|nr:hypothetical protein BCR41DRAFT_397007 [Lobosporangium transversale]KAF9914427.1 hypothetical protein BX616_008315 [Lobosporangium transversale]ORZ13845.1 hypothetical protein BCR41DRAFT_397007 [Lobosporangium transversale]|eukprot:XP_021880629.1 hypothetical protein BCR41DRAFT_397007 [Lobosporangium transversale]
MIRRAAYKQVFVIDSPWSQPPQQSHGLNEPLLSSESPQSSLPSLSSSPSLSSLPSSTSSSSLPSLSITNSLQQQLDTDNDDTSIRCSKIFSAHQVPVHLFKRQRAILLKDLERIAPEFEYILTEQGTVVFSRSEPPSPSVSGTPAKISSLPSSSLGQKQPPAFIAIHEEMEDKNWYIYVKPTISMSSPGNTTTSLLLRNPFSVLPTGSLPTQPSSLRGQGKGSGGDPEELNQDRRAGYERRGQQERSHPMLVEEHIDQELHVEDGGGTRSCQNSVGQSQYESWARSWILQSHNTQMRLSTSLSTFTYSSSSSSLFLPTSTSTKISSSSSLHTMAIPSTTCTAECRWNTAALQDQLTHLAQTLISVVDNKDGAQEGHSSKDKVRKLASSILETLPSPASTHKNIGLATPEVTPTSTPLIFASPRQSPRCSGASVESSSNSQGLTEFMLPNTMLSTLHNHSHGHDHGLNDNNSSLIINQTSEPMLRDSVSHFSNYYMNFPPLPFSPSTLPPTIAQPMARSLSIPKEEVEGTASSSKQITENQHQQKVKSRKNSLLSIFDKNISQTSRRLEEDREGDWNQQHQQHLVGRIENRKGRSRANSWLIAKLSPGSNSDSKKQKQPLVQGKQEPAHSPSPRSPGAMHGSCSSLFSSPLPSPSLSPSPLSPFPTSQPSKRSLSRIAPSLTPQSFKRITASINFRRRSSSTPMSSSGALPPVASHAGVEPTATMTSIPERPAISMNRSHSIDIGSYHHHSHSVCYPRSISQSLSPSVTSFSAPRTPRTVATASFFDSASDDSDTTDDNEDPPCSRPQAQRHTSGLQAPRHRQYLHHGSRSNHESEFMVPAEEGLQHQVDRDTDTDTDTGSDTESDSDSDSDFYGTEDAGRSVNEIRHGQRQDEPERQHHPLSHNQQQLNSLAQYAIPPTHRQAVAFDLQTLAGYEHQFDNVPPPSYHSLVQAGNAPRSSSFNTFIPFESLNVQPTFADSQPVNIQAIEQTLTSSTSVRSLSPPLSQGSLSSQSGPHVRAVSHQVLNTLLELLHQFENHIQDEFKTPAFKHRRPNTNRDHDHDQSHSNSSTPTATAVATAAAAEWHNRRPQNVSSFAYLLIELQQIGISSNAMSELWHQPQQGQQHWLTLTGNASSEAELATSLIILEKNCVFGMDRERWCGANGTREQWLNSLQEIVENS